MGRVWRLYQHLLGQSVRPSEATGVLPAGTVAEVRVTALESVWRAMRRYLGDHHLFPSIQAQIEAGIDKAVAVGSVE